MLGLRCCGIRCMKDKPVRASWKAREDMTGVILHRDSLVDHSPRRTLALLSSLGHTHQTGICTLPSQAGICQPVQSTSTDVESRLGIEQLVLEQDLVQPLKFAEDNVKVISGIENKTATHDRDVSTHTLSVEVHELSEL